MKLHPLSILVLVSLVATAACGTQGTKAELEAAQAAAAAGTSGSGSIDPRTSTVALATPAAQTVLPYALYTVSGSATSASKKYVLTTSSYNLCGWGIAHGWAGHPNRSSILAMYLLNQTAGSIQAPIAGTYQVATPGAGATGMYIDPGTSGYGVFADACSGTWPGLKSGTVTVTSIDGRGIIAGTVDVVLNDDSTLKGDFTTSSCTGREIDGTDGKATDCNW